MADIEKINRSELVSAELINDLRRIINSARSHVAATANYELTMMYWHIGNRINRDVLNNERAEYGQQIVSTLSTQLTELYGEDFYLDLLFYHRKLHRLIAIDLKLGRFKAQYKGQMDLYLRWLEQNEMQPGEETPLGLLLCTEGSEEQISLLQLDKSGIRVAQDLTELPSKKVLLRQLQKSLAVAKETNLSQPND